MCFFLIVILLFGRGRKGEGEKRGRQKGGGRKKERNIKKDREREGGETQENDSAT